LSYGNGMQLTMDYWPARQQPKSMKVAPAGNPNALVLHYSYSYNDAGGHNNNRIRQITDHVDNNYSMQYSYDNYHRLSYAGNFLIGGNLEQWFFVLIHPLCLRLRRHLQT
jgi:hypothetical protein